MAADHTPDDASDDKGSSDMGSSDKDESKAGTSLAPAASGAAGIDPFLAKASEAPAAATPDAARPFYAKALDYSAHAAMIVGLVGFAWTVSDHVVKHQPAVPTKAAEAAAAPKPAEPLKVDAAKVDATKVDEIGELRRANQKMAAELRTLHANLDALRTTVVRERGADDTRALSASIDTLRSSLASARGETGAAIAQLSGKVDKLQREVRAPQVTERVAERAAARPERQAVDTTSTGSIPTPPAKAVPTPPAKPTTLASVDDDAKAVDKPAPISGWVVRDVYQGVALLEGKRGQMEVVPGVSIPGAGIVKSIERHGAGWTVTTSKGQIAYAAPQREAAPRDYGRGPYERDYYSRRYGY